MRMEELKRVLESLDVHPNTLSILLTVFIVATTLFLFWFLNRKPSQNKNVLLLGITNSGKTALFCQLVYKSKLLTQISITPNQGKAHFERNQSLKEKNIDLVDIPGQSKIRNKFFQIFKKTAKAIVFVIDSAAFQKEVKDVAEFLYQVLSDETLIKSKLKILIVCNKQDIEFARGETFIRNNLEKEIELLRKISSSALESTGGSKSNQSSHKNLLTSNSDKTFEFSDLKYLNVNFCEASSLDLEKLEPVREWLHVNL